MTKHNIYEATEQNLDKAAETIKNEYPSLELYTGHCTGEPAFRILKETLKDRLEDMFTGQCVEIDG